ncbi:alpha-ketoacid dehydrogenase kinase [Schizopora paradoxa]|uniref:Protein-serine/threonine kinase n=1 Tax=Schizopora paradoxa TaxID=27342 RepID=A0A0H2RYK8_9AGAM|nr:alpha-ketoacid dehydrogenase kinase [Schizopora paradoxa]
MFIASSRGSRAFRPALLPTSSPVARRQPASPEVIALLTSYGQQTARPLTLSRLLSFGNPVTQDSILSSASYALSEIPRRLSRRIRSLESLPFIVGTNPHVSRTLDAYRRSFEWLATYPAVRTLRDNADFATQLEHLVHSHANDIPTMAKGFQECYRYMTPGAINEFLDTAIRNRIAVRLIAEQHIALSHALSEYGHQGKHDGVVDMKCSPADMVRACSVIVSEMCEATFGASPEVVIDGHVDSTFAYVPVHLQYVLTELLKNAFRATVEKHWRSHGLSSASDLPPVLVTISPPPRIPGIVRPSYMSIRVRDEGGGVSPHNMARVFSYAFSTAKRSAQHADEDAGGGPYAAQQIGGNAATMEVGAKGDAGLFSEMTGKGIQAGVGTLAGLGYGLPMSRLYARYLGGSLDLFSLDGWGTDAFLKLRCLDEAGDVEI